MRRYKMATAIPQKSLSERVIREKEELLSAQPRLDIERLKFMLETYKETEGEPEVMRRAKLFERLCSQKTISIDNNPIVGTLTKYKYGGYVVPEIGCRWMKKVEAVQLQRGGEIPIGEEEREWLDKAADYWKDRNVFNRTHQVILEMRGIDIGLLQKVGTITEVTPGGFVQAIPDYARPLNKGLKGIIAEIEMEKRKLDIGNFEDMGKLFFYDSALICLHAAIKLSRRYASLAREMAREETGQDSACLASLREMGKGEASLDRKGELERIADTCEWVPANPARSFYEALQSLWFFILATWIETPVVLFAPPLRFTQYMYPFFKKDKDEGKINDEKVIELLQFFFLKINGLGEALPPHGRAYSASRIGSQLSLGGLTPDGKDATNELDWLVLEAQERIRLPEPLINVMYHDKLSEDFLLKCVDLIRTGIGQPAFQDTDKAIARHLYHDKVSLEEARNVCIAGCVQSVIPGDMYFHWEGYFNTAKMIELVLNNGRDPLSGLQIGLQTGDVDSFQSYADLYEAVNRQLKYFIPIMRDIGRVAWNMTRSFPSPFSSAVHTHDCVRNGKDIAEGGPKYPVGNGVSMLAVVDLANSLAAIKKLVFEENKMTLKQLNEALRADFEGFEEIQKMCLNAPKYGNDDDSVDSIVRDIYHICWEEHQRFPDFLGRPVKPEAYSVIGHSATGRFTGALPNGRKARLALTDASVSAQPGTDKNGPTALIKSAGKAIDTIKYGGNHFNMKFHPSALQGLEGARKFLQLIKTYFELGGYHVQFNCVNSETLKDAQLQPENFRDLIVRVAGFSAYFVTLDKLTQDEIIKRTELKWS
jgi:formate C-acetyltransferase